MVYLLGSSPCIRGGFSTKSRMEATKGTIPAHTGQIYGEVPEFRVPETHPRAYGADYRELHDIYLSVGSSPCIRGRFLLLLKRKARNGLIPVYTGQILNFSSKFLLLASRFPSPWTSATEPVCIILAGYIFADNAFWSISVRNDAYFGNCGTANSPPYIRSRSLRTEAGDIMVGFIPVYMGLECINTYYKTIRE